MNDGDARAVPSIRIPLEDYDAEVHRGGYVEIAAWLTLEESLRSETDGMHLSVDAGAAAGENPNGMRIDGLDLYAAEVGVFRRVFRSAQLSGEQAVISDADSFLRAAEAGVGRWVLAVVKDYYKERAAPAESKSAGETARRLAGR